MFKRGLALLHPFRETCITFQRGRGVPLRCYSATTPQAFLTDTPPTGSSGVATLLVFITSHPTTLTLLAAADRTADDFPPRNNVKTHTRRNMHSGRGDRSSCPSTVLARNTCAPHGGTPHVGRKTRRRFLGRKLVKTPANRKL